MTDLHARLRGVIEERLALAKAAEPGSWRAFGEAVGVEVDGCTCAGFPPYGHEPHCGYEPIALRMPEPIVSFIAAHDPVDAIRRHEAALRVLERHRAEDGCCPNCGRLREDWVYDSEADEEFRETDWDAQPWPCPDIRDLAASYGVKSEASDCKPGDRCNSCLSEDTYLNDDGHPACRGCGRSDEDDD